MWKSRYAYARAVSTIPVLFFRIFLRLFARKFGHIEYRPNGPCRTVRC